TEKMNQSYKIVNRQNTCQHLHSKEYNRRIKKFIRCFLNSIGLKLSYFFPGHEWTTLIDNNIVIEFFHPAMVIQYYPKSQNKAQRSDNTPEDDRTTWNISCSGIIGPVMRIAITLAGPLHATDPGTPKEKGRQGSYFLQV